MRRAPPSGRLLLLNEKGRTRASGPPFSISEVHFHSQAKLDPTAMSSTTTSTHLQRTSSELDLLLAEKAAAIHKLIKRTRQDAVEIGQHLIEVRDEVDRGKWLIWLETEFDWSDQTAYRFIHVSKLYCDARFHTVWNLKLPFSIIYRLAAPKAEEARQEIVKQIDSGEPVTEETVIAAVTGRRNAPETDPAESSHTKPDPKASNAKAGNDDEPADVSAKARMAAYAASEAIDGAVEHDPADPAVPVDEPADPVKAAAPDTDTEEQHPGVPEQHGADGDDCGAAVDVVGADDVVAARPAPEPEPEETLVDHRRRCPGALCALLDDAGIELVLAAMSPAMIAALQARAKQPTNLVLKLRELDRVAAAQLLVDAFGWDRLEAIVGTARKLRAPRGRSGKSDKSGKPFTKTINLTAENSCPTGTTTVSGNNAGKAGCSPKRASR
jgi:Protein of unknown function (DUF3102)